MFALVIIILVCTGAKAGTFNITDLFVPEVVPADQNEVEIECRYDANFTLLNWFKGPNEFFRYKPGAAPSTRSWPVLGVGKIDIVTCGPTACRLRLGSLTDDASGLYKCDIERDVPPYKFEDRSAYMQVQGHLIRKPLLELSADEFGEGEEIQAFCRGSPDSEIRWYINGVEIRELKGTAWIKRKASKLMFMGLPPTITVQCAEFNQGKLSGSKQVHARWKSGFYKDERAQEQRNSSHYTTRAVVLSTVLSLIIQILVVFY